MQDYSIKPFSLLFISTICILISCSIGEKKVEAISSDHSINIYRYNEVLDRWSNNLDDFNLLDVEKDSPAFTDVYIHQILALPRDSVIIKQELTRMLQDTGFQKLMEDVNTEFRDLTKVENEIGELLHNYTKAYEVSETPKVYSFISGFVYQCFVFDDIEQEGIGIGLDMFLGADFPYAHINPSNPAFSGYLTQFYAEDYIVKKVAEVLVEDKLPSPQRSDFLSMMIWGGKKLYLIDELIPFKSDDVVMEYTPEQYKWCQENEAEMWDFFFDKELFYETDIRKFNKLIGPSPTTPGMPSESPGRTANYMGWQIVKKYMADNPEITIEDLITEQNAQKILDAARYKPRR
jgi:hypothetical protein